MLTRISGCDLIARPKGKINKAFNVVFGLCHELVTWNGSALHPRGSIHCITKNAEFWQLCANQPRYAIPGMDPDAYGNHFIVVRHADLSAFNWKLMILVG